jgi:hypothetical protein
MRGNGKGIYKLRFTIYNLQDIPGGGIFGGSEIPQPHSAATPPATWRDGADAAGGRQKRTGAVAVKSPNPLL